MIDLGHALEPEFDARRQGLASRDPADWSAADLAAYKAPQLTQDEGEIRRYGSDFPARDTEGLLEAGSPWLGLRPSFARGGLSNAWGAAVAPYRQADLAGWPIGVEALADHYRAVAQFMPIAGRHDALADFFPVQDMSGARPLAASAQARGLLSRIERRGKALAARGMTGGAARQAVRTDCRLCGLCLHGCPYEYIFKASQVVDDMLREPGFSYRAGLRAVSFEEGQRGVRLVCRRPDGAVEALEGERLFLAGGVLPTAELVLSTLAPAAELILHDSQHLFLPMLHLWSAGADPAREPRHALTQVFLELDDPRVSPFSVHAQLYTYSEFYAADMKRRYGARAPFAGPLFDAVTRRLIVAQLFLHSEHSHRIALRLAGGGGRLAARLAENLDVVSVAARARAAYARAVRALGLLALTPASRMGAPGSSFHVGGSLPMRGEPGRLETDLLGRPAGLSRVHVVDASVFPTIPATTITYSVMANAHRIGATAD